MPRAAAADHHHTVWTKQTEMNASNDLSRQFNSSKEMPKGRILIVDDEASIQRYLNSLLTRNGYSASVAANGIEALSLLDREAFAVVLLDIYMPVKGGFETLIDLMKRHPGTKVVAMSGASLFGPKSSLDIAQSLGAHALLEKPFTPTQLLTTIEGLLSAGGQSTTA